jgi:hypothetical protein
MISERLYEIVLVLVVAVIVFAFGIAEIKDFVKESRIIVLRTDLRKLRNAIALHRVNKNAYPPTLEKVASNGLGENMALMLYNIDDKGRARDPFGRCYFYDPVTGEVRSKTPGYHNY